VSANSFNTRCLKMTPMLNCSSKEGMSSLYWKYPFSNYTNFFMMIILGEGKVFIRSIQPRWQDPNFWDPFVRSYRQPIVTKYGITYTGLRHVLTVYHVANHRGGTTVSTNF